MKTCNICGAVFVNSRLYANHVRWKHNDQTEFKEKIAKIATERQNQNVTLIERTCNNVNCGNTFIVKFKNGNPPKHNKIFCSRSCSNIVRKHSDETKQRIADSQRTSEKAKIARTKNFLNQSENQKKIFSSKAERAILKYLKDNYPNQKWTSGGTTAINGERLARDMFSPILGVCIEYDGIWHFKDIHGQLEMKQKKDKLLNEWCEINGWKMIRISEKYWTSIGQNLSKIDEILSTLAQFSTVTYFY